MKNNNVVKFISNNLIIFLVLFFLIFLFVHNNLDPEIPITTYILIVNGDDVSVRYLESEFREDSSVIKFNDITGKNLEISTSSFELNDLILNNNSIFDRCLSTNNVHKDCDIGNVSEGSIIELKIDKFPAGFFSFDVPGVNQWIINFYLKDKYDCHPNCLEISAQSEKTNSHHYKDQNRFRISQQTSGMKNNHFNQNFYLNLYNKKIKNIKSFLYVVLVSLLFFILSMIKEKIDNFYKDNDKGDKMKDKTNKLMIWIILLVILIILAIFTVIQKPETLMTFISLLVVVVIAYSIFSLEQQHKKNKEHVRNENLLNAFLIELNDNFQFQENLINLKKPYQTPDLMNMPPHFRDFNLNIMETVLFENNLFVDDYSSFVILIRLYGLWKVINNYLNFLRNNRVSPGDLEQYISQIKMRLNSIKKESFKKTIKKYMINNNYKIKREDILN